MEDIQEFFAVCPPKTEEFAAAELRRIGAQSVEALPGGVSFQGTLALGYRANLQSRIATRILRRIAGAPYTTADEIYEAAREIRWENWLRPGQTIRIDLSAHRSPLESLNFAVLRIKDAVCDRMTAKTGGRPGIDKAAPDLRIFAHLTETWCTVYIDMSGEPLFKRGWRRDKGEAPLKENLAAALLHIAGWTPDQPLADIFCGSGTIAIEAATIAANMAPGLNRRFAFESHADFQADRWRDIREEARAVVDFNRRACIRASDISSIVVEQARANARLAGLDRWVLGKSLEFRTQDARRAMPPSSSGVLVCNPPYGEQSHPKSAPVPRMMKDVSDNLKRNWGGWTAWMLTSDMRLPSHMRLSETRRAVLFNGPIECRFFRFEMVDGSYRRQERRVQPAEGGSGGPDSES